LLLADFLLDFLLDPEDEYIHSAQAMKLLCTNKFGMEAE
jgi:hypothetical protein